MNYDTPVQSVQNLNAHDYLVLGQPGQHQSVLASDLVQSGHSNGHSVPVSLGLNPNY